MLSEHFIYSGPSPVHSCPWHPAASAVALAVAFAVAFAVAGAVALVVATAGAGTVVLAVALALTSSGLSFMTPYCRGQIPIPTVQIDISTASLSDLMANFMTDALYRLMRCVYNRTFQK